MEEEIQHQVCGESGDVSGETVQSWKERLLEIFSVYLKENTWNTNELEFFGKALPENEFAQKGDNPMEERKVR